MMGHDTKSNKVKPIWDVYSIPCRHEAAHVRDLIESGTVVGFSWVLVLRDNTVRAGRTGVLAKNNDRTFGTLMRIALDMNDEY